MTNNSEFAGNMLCGARAIAQFLYGDGGKKFQRRIYYLHSQKRLPTFNWGTAGICCRRTTLVQFVEEQERRKFQ